MATDPVEERSVRWGTMKEFSFSIAREQSRRPAHRQPCAVEQSSRVSLAWRLERAFEDFVHLPGCEFDWICLHAAGARGFPDQRGEVVRRDAMAAKRLDLQVRAEMPDPRDAFSGAGPLASGEELGNLVIPAHLPGPGGAFVQRDEIGLHDVWQKCGADGAMRGGEHAANGRGETVHRPETGVG